MTRIPARFVVPAIAAYMVAMMLVAVPVNSDEAVMYHPLACSQYVNAPRGDFLLPCDGRTSLNLFGVTVPRAYWYIGSLSSYIYWPFFELHPAMATQRLLGAIFLVGIVWVSTRLEPTHVLSVLVIIGLSFPLVYQLVADTGPVRYGLLAMLLTPLMTAAICRAQSARRAWLLNAFLAVLLFLAVEDKPFFLYFMPSLAALAIAYCPGERPLPSQVQYLLSRTWLSIAVFGVLTALFLLGARTGDGSTYFQALASRASEQSQNLASAAVVMASYLTNFEKFTSMVYPDRQFRLLNVSLSLLVWLLGSWFVSRAWTERPAVRPRLAWTAVALVLSMAALLAARNAWTGHHFVYSLVIALLLLCQGVALVRPGRGAFLVVCGLVTVVLASELPLLRADARWSRERYEVFDYLERPDVARDHVIVHRSDGTYYLASLYGHSDQLTVRINDLGEEAAVRLIRLSNETGRRLLFVCRVADCDVTSLSEEFFDQVAFEAAPLETTDWKVFVETTRSADLTARQDMRDTAREGWSVATSFTARPARTQ